MWWWMLPAASAMLGANKAAKQQEAQKANNLAQSELTRYSPWTGMKGQLDTSYAPSALEGGLSGGVAGLGMMQAGQSAFGGGAPIAPTADASGANSLGGTDMANQMGQDYGMPQQPGMQMQELSKPNFFASYQPRR
jgi:hypothetical protein